MTDQIGKDFEIAASDADDIEASKRDSQNSKNIYMNGEGSANQMNSCSINSIVNNYNFNSPSKDTPEKIVFNGEGKYHGHALGEYYLIDAKEIRYKQSSSEEIDEVKEPRFLSRVDGVGWFVSDTYIFDDEAYGCLFNSSQSKTVPRSGWKYFDYHGKWQNDVSIVIHPGELKRSCNGITVSLAGAAAEKWPKCAGNFIPVSWQIFNGRHIYRNEHDMLLYCDNDGGWAIGDKLNQYCIRSNSAPSLPSSHDYWKYWNFDFRWGSIIKEASVKVTIHRP